MKTYKRVDLWFQVVAISLTLLTLIWTEDHLLTFYIIIIGWQLISVAIHIILRDRYLPVKLRKYFHYMLLPLSLSTWLFAVPSLQFVYLVIMILVVLPVTMLGYVYICWEENKRLAHKDLIHLK